MHVALEILCLQVECLPIGSKKLCFKNGDHSFILSTLRVIGLDQGQIMVFKYGSYVHETHLKRFGSSNIQRWDAESRQTALYLVNGWDLRPALWRASCWPFLRNILLKKFLDQSNFIAHFCKKCEIPLYSPLFLGFATESRHPFFAQKY